MTVIRAFGIEVEASAGWEARIFRLPNGEPTLHAASFPLPVEDGEFGANATRHMKAHEAFLSVTEYRVDGKLTPGRGLFAADKPRAIAATAFSPNALLRGSHGQLGSQKFFTAAGRPFGLYAVVGSAAALPPRLGELNALLAALSVAALTAG
jgi:hypothetical protein